MRLPDCLISLRRSWSIGHLPTWYEEAEGMLRSVLSQRTAFEARTDESLDTVVFGSSHAHKGFLAEGHDFNFANSHVDLYTSARLFEKLCDRGVRMRRAVLFYDVFSSGFEMQRTHSWYKAVPYELLFGITFYAPKPEKYGRLAWCLAHVPDVPEEMDPCGNNRFDWFFPPETDVSERVASHMKNHERGTSQDTHVGRFVACARRCGAEPVVVVAPLRKDYLRELDKFGDVFADMRMKCETQWNVPFCDFSHCESFMDVDFGDMDHLNRLGAQKLTRVLKQKLEEANHV